jgi:hypothetical protein
MFQAEGVYCGKICCVVKGKERENGNLGGVRSGNNMIKRKLDYVERCRKVL